MKKIILSLAMVFAALSMMARPAYPGFRTVTQPDGTRIVLKAHGDEWGHWFTDNQGRVVAKDADGFFRPVQGVTPEMAAQTATIRRKARVQQRAAASASGHVAVGQKNFLVILVEFNDVHFKTSNVRTEVSNLLNQQGYSKNGASGSARDFYYENSNGYFEPTFDVYGPVTLENDMSYYGANDYSGYDKNAEQAVVDGCKGLDSQIDYSKYDIDGDGCVDLVFMLYAGYGEADYDDEDTIWPHMYYLSYAGKSLKLDGKTIEKYACANELAGYGELAGKLDGIGAVCHEFGHSMGLPDFYDTDGTDSNGQAGGMYDFSTMDAGNYNNAARTPPYFTMEERIMLGWNTEADYLEFPGSGNVTIPAFKPENGTPVAYRTPTDVNGEYFVYECRGSKDWDAGLSGHGLMVYHVDRSTSHSVSISGVGSVKASQLWADWEAYNGINTNGKHPCCYVVVSSDQDELNFAPEYYAGYGYYYQDNGDQCVFPGSDNITTYTAKSWSKTESDYKLSNISYSSQSQSVTLKVTAPVAETALDYPVIANPGNGVYSAGGSFTFALEESAARPSSSVVWYYDGVKQTTATKSLTAGKHTIEAEVTLESGKKNTVTLEIQVK